MLKITCTTAVSKEFVASSVHIPASISSSEIMTSLLSLSKKRGLAEVTFSLDGFFHITSGFGIPETFQIRVTGKPAVGFLVGNLGSRVNFGASKERK